MVTDVKITRVRKKADAVWLLYIRVCLKNRPPLHGKAGDKQIIQLPGQSVFIEPGRSSGAVPRL